MITTREGEITMANQAIGRFLNRNPEEMIGKWIGSIFPENLLDKDVWRSSLEFPPGEFVLYGPSKELLAKSVTMIIRPVSFEHRSFVVCTLKGADDAKEAQKETRKLISSLQETNERLELLVNADPLTELLNRRGLENVLLREISFARRNKTDLLAALVDLDDFKKINDAWGHATGDLVLKTVAGILKDSVRLTDWISRVGGDEFLILLPTTSLTDSVTVAERMRLMLASKEIHMNNGTSIRVTASIGLVELPYTTCSLEEVLELAKAALKSSKKAGKNSVYIGASTTKSVTGEAHVKSLKMLLDGNGEFRVVHQPIYKLENESIEGYELFSRGPVGLLEMPDEFFRVAGENQVLTLMDLHCFKICLAHAKTLEPNKNIHINMFPSTLAEMPLGRLASLIDEAGLKGKICIELSQHRLMADPSFLLKKSADLKAAGILLAMDDVGFGCSSMESLLLLEPDIMKLDGHFVNKISIDDGKKKALSKLISVASVLGTRIIAEGIESSEDLHTIKELGVQWGQGWLWGRPR